MANLNTKFTQSRIASMIIGDICAEITLRHRYWSHDVRVFYFCPATGLYQGEGFQDDYRLETDEGVTTVAPPEYRPGEVPVFNRSGQQWVIESLHDWTIRHKISP